MKKNKKNTTQTQHTQGVLDNATKESAEHIITEALMNNKGDREINEGITGAKFGVFNETEVPYEAPPLPQQPHKHPHTLPVNDMAELTPLQPQQMPEFDDIPRYGEELNGDDKEDPKATPFKGDEPEQKEQSKEKKKKNPLKIFMIVTFVAVLVGIGAMVVLPMLSSTQQQPSQEPVQNNEVQEIIVSQGNDTEPEADVSKAKARITPASTDAELSINDTLAVTNNINKAIVSYHEDIKTECEKYLRDINYDIESNVKPYRDAIYKDLSNLKTYETFFNNYGGDEVYNAEKSRLENLYMYIETLRNDSGSNKILKNSNGFIENENKINDKTNDAIERYLLANNINYSRNEDFISYIPVDSITFTEAPEETVVPELVETEAPVNTEEPIAEEGENSEQEA